MGLSCIRFCSGTICSPTDAPDDPRNHACEYGVGWAVSCGRVAGDACGGLSSGARHIIGSGFLLARVCRTPHFRVGLVRSSEGIIDHQLLGVHYVRQVTNYTIYNMTFLALGGVGLILVGAVSCGRAARCHRGMNVGAERTHWRSLSALTLLMPAERSSPTKDVF